MNVVIQEQLMDLVYQKMKFGAQHLTVATMLTQMLVGTNLLVWNQ